MAHKTPRRPKKRKVTIGEITLEVYTVGWLALAADREPSTIKLWEKNKVLPGPLLDIDSPWRFYTADEIIGYVRALNQSELKSGRATMREFTKACIEVRTRVRNLLEKSPGKAVRYLPGQEFLLSRAKEKQVAPPDDCQTFWNNLD